jgi:hypothetical protein
MLQDFQDDDWIPPFLLTSQVKAIGFTFIGVDSCDSWTCLEPKACWEFKLN